MNNGTREKRLTLLDITSRSVAYRSNFHTLQKLDIRLESAPSVGKDSQVTSVHVRHAKRAGVLLSLGSKPNCSITSLLLRPLQLCHSMFTKSSPTPLKINALKCILDEIVRDEISGEKSTCLAGIKTIIVLSSKLSEIHWKQASMNLRNLKLLSNSEVRAHQVLRWRFEITTISFQLSVLAVLAVLVDPCARTFVANQSDGSKVHFRLNKLNGPNARIFS